MKKLLALLLVFLMLVTTFTGCSGTDKDTSSDPADVSSEDTYSEPEDTAEEPSEPEDTYSEPEYDDYEEPDMPEEEDEEDVPLTPAQQRKADMLAGLDEGLNKDALAYEGELGRLAKAIKKAKSGKTVNIVFYGNGNNTAANAQTSADTPYADVFAEWFNANVGSCEVYKAGIEGLTSSNACLRLEHDVFRFEPDIVFIDFAIQDSLKDVTKNKYAYDNLIRRILNYKTSPAVVSMMLTGVDYKEYRTNSKNAGAFKSVSKQQKEIAKYYKIPIIDFEYALWENMYKVLEVTPQMETPLVTWANIGANNVTLNNDGHQILAGTVRYLFETVISKLNKISTKNYAYPTASLFDNNDYMNTSFVTVGDIIEGNAKGYQFDIVGKTETYKFDVKAAEKSDDHGYVYKAKSDKESMSPSILTQQHYIYNEKDNKKLIDYEINPYYLTLTLPEVTNEETYFMVYTTYRFGAYATDIAALDNYSPFSMICENANGESTHPGSLCVKFASEDLTYYKATPSCGKTSILRIPKGTTKITFRIYDTKQQGNVYLLGVAQNNK